MKDINKIVNNCFFVMVVIIIITISLFSLLLTFGMFGIPFGKQIAKINIKSYLSSRYANREFIIGDIHYNCKSTSYNTIIYDENNDSFTGMCYYWESNSIVDGRFVQLLHKSLEKDITNIVNRSAPNIYIADCLIHSKTSTNQDFRTDYLKRKDTINITLRNKTETCTLNKESYIGLVAEILDYLKENYQVDRVEIHYLDKNFVRKNSYILNLKGYQIYLPKEEMAKHIKMPEGSAWK